MHSVIGGKPASPPPESAASSGVPEPEPPLEPLGDVVPLALALPDVPDPEALPEVPDPEALPDVDPLVDAVPPLDAPAVPLDAPAVPLDAPAVPLVLAAPVVPPGACCTPVVPLEHARKTVQPNAAAERKPMESSRFTQSFPPLVARALDGAVVRAVIKYEYGG
jgi:hypothetical protein